MKKSIVVLLVVLALIVLISPAFVGWLAERSVEEQIEWAAEESNEAVIVRAERFDRGWLSSEGRHRIELQNTANVAAAKSMLLGMSDDDELPDLLVDTRLDHGIIPVGSLAREEGSLSPGLGSAVSTLSLEYADGRVVELPGAIYSKIGLDGDLVSNYKIDAGSQDDLEWGRVDVSFAADATDHTFGYDGVIESLFLTGEDQHVDLTMLKFKGDLTQTNFGVAVGDVKMSLGSMEFLIGGSMPATVGPIIFESITSLDGDRLNSDGAMNLTMSGIPQMDGLSMDFKGRASGVDAAALGRLQQAANALPAGSDPAVTAQILEDELKDLLAAGLAVNFERLNLSMPQGDINAVVDIEVAESDRATFAWSSLLLAVNADIRLEMSESIVMMAQLMSPNAVQLEQFLVKNGDVYEVEAAYKRGVMTINGVPLALPIQ